MLCNISCEIANSRTFCVRMRVFKNYSHLSGLCGSISRCESEKRVWLGASLHEKPIYL